MPLTDCSDGAGYLSVYLSEPLARYPIRHVSKPADNKSDPNIETGTYGLFSTCERTMRGKLVREGRRWIFFLTKHAGKERRLAGYYEIGWYAEGAGGAALGDYALAATSMRFIEPLALEALPELARDRCLPPFRTVRPIEGPVVQLLRKVIDDQPDCTSAYLRELRRIEQFTRYYSGYAYPSWGQVEGFSWELAAHYLRKAPGANPHPAVPASGRWRCSACERIVRSKAFLKSCPVCGALLTLTPISEIG
jgi:hypothetical protein